jgi:hypothetical protein
MLSWWYGPDNAMLTYFCATSHKKDCGFLPFHTVANWHFFDSDSVRRVVLTILLKWICFQNALPWAIQVDTGESSAGKLARLTELGLDFINWEARRCLNPSLSKLLAHKAQRGTRSTTEQLRFYHRLGAFVDSLPFLGGWLRSLLPLLSYYVYITL